LGLSRVNKGLKGYRTQEIEPDNNPVTYEPGENVQLDIEKYTPYIQKIARRFYKKLPPNSRWDFDEFVSEAWVALIECAQNYYNPAYNDSLKAFAYPYIVKRLSEFMATNMYTLKARYYNVKQNEENLEKINWLERTLWSESQSTFANGRGGNNEGKSDALKANPLLSKPSGIESIMDEVAELEEQDIIKEIVNSDLPPKERRAIVRRFRDGETYKDIGRRLNVSAETARKLVMRGLEKIKRKALDAGIND